ncbi:IS66 family insertion sequence element accessory protein TnpB [Pedobacter sp. V48]|uniref:IS66 family insertion sequence element accessory protein TnpB n=1 Tax=Pedobacter sp. V48 TaxID=509635 RepID=UPI000A029D0C
MWIHEFRYATHSRQRRSICFLSHSRTQIKLLHWEEVGFLRYYKRLEQETFLLQKARERKCYGAI